MTIKKFLVLSLLTHAIILFSINFIPVEKEKKTDEFLAKIIFPEELDRSKIKKPKEKMHTVPSLRQRIIKTPLLQNDQIKLKQMQSQKKPASSYTENDTSGSPMKDLYSKTGKGYDENKNNSRAQPLKPEYSAREKLFDKDIVGNLAKRDIEKEVKGDNSITFDTKEYQYAGYMRKLKEKIESIWAYPPEAKAAGIYGDLKIRFTIRKNGRLGAVELVRTSGYKMLDDAAIKALKDGEPYWPLPDEWDMESHTISGHFIYSLFGYYVR